MCLAELLGASDYWQGLWQNIIHPGTCPDNGDGVVDEFLEESSPPGGDPSSVDSVLPEFLTSNFGWQDACWGTGWAQTTSPAGVSVGLGIRVASEGQLRRRRQAP